MKSTALLLALLTLLPQFSLADNVLNGVKTGTTQTETGKAVTYDFSKITAATNPDDIKAALGSQTSIPKDGTVTLSSAYGLKTERKGAFSSDDTTTDQTITTSITLVVKDGKIVGFKATESTLGRYITGRGSVMGDGFVSSRTLASRNFGTTPEEKEKIAAELDNASPKIPAKSVASVNTGSNSTQTNQKQQTGNAVQEVSETVSPSAP